MLRRNEVWIPVAGAALLVVLIALIVIRNHSDDGKKLTFSEVIAAARDGKLRSIVVTGEDLDVRLKNDPQKYDSRLDRQTDLVATLDAARAVLGGTDDRSVDVEYRSARFHPLILIARWAIFLAAGGAVVYAAVFLAVRHANRRS